MTLDPTVSPLVYYGLQVTDVTVELSPNSSKWIQSFDIKVDSVTVNGHLKDKGTAGICRTMRVVLERPSVVVLSLQVTAHLRYKNILKQNWRDVEFTVNAQELSAIQTQGSPEGTRQWRGAFGKVNLIVGFTTRATHPIERTISEATASIRNVSLDNAERALTPTTESILRDCPRFRILVMGKTGVGKSRLINKTFGVNDALVSHTNPGDANIDREILSQENPHFILHDSKGFEQGDDANVKIVQEFINRRNNMPLLKDKVHAVWLCLDIPTAGGRLLETGIEQFLKLKIERKLGNVPVIAVFTKYDLLVLHENRMLKRVDRDKKTKEEISQLVEQNATTILQEACIEPFENFVELTVPHVTVSTEYGYETRLENLIQTTYDHVHESYKDASVVSAIAQRVSPRVTIKASIEVGRRKYWNRLASSVSFFGKTLQQCLEVIHTDIVRVWRFNDPEEYLSSPSFKAIISNIVTDGADINAQSGPTKKLAAGISLIGGIAGIVTALSGPAAPIVIPIAAVVVTAKWVYDVYQKTAVVLRLLMTYIIDLTLILQNIFWLQVLTGKGRPLSRKIIKAGARAYRESNTKQSLAFYIDRHLEGASFHVGPDAILTAIVELIESNIIDSEEMLDQRSRFPIPDIIADEAWEAHETDMGT